MNPYTIKALREKCKAKGWTIKGVFTVHADTLRRYPGEWLVRIGKKYSYERSEHQYGDQRIAIRCALQFLDKLPDLKGLLLLLLVSATWAASPSEYKPLVTDLMLGAGMHGKVVAVSELTYTDGRQSSDGRVVADRLTTELAHSKDIKTIERSKIDQVMGELKLQRSGAVDPESVSDIGMLLGAGVVIVGTLTDMPEKRLAVNLRAVDVASGLIIAGADGTIRRTWVTPQATAEVVNLNPISLGQLLKHQEPAGVPAAAPTEATLIGEGCGADIYFLPPANFVRRPHGKAGPDTPIRKEESQWCNFAAYIGHLITYRHQDLQRAWVEYKQANSL
jgi:hypothetical protein